jgi:hypothetical protein
MSHLSVQTKLETVPSNLYYYFQKQIQLLSLLWMNRCTVYLQFFNKGCAAILCIFISTTYIIKFFSFICIIFFVFWATVWFTNPNYLPHQSEVAKVYSICLKTRLKAHVSRHNSGHGNCGCRSRPPLLFRVAKITFYISRKYDTWHVKTSQ